MPIPPVASWTKLARPDSMAPISVVRTPSMVTVEPSGSARAAAIGKASGLASGLGSGVCCVAAGVGLRSSEPVGTEACGCAVGSGVGADGSSGAVCEGGASVAPGVGCGLAGLDPGSFVGVAAVVGTAVAVGVGADGGVTVGAGPSVAPGLGDGISSGAGGAERLCGLGTGSISQSVA